MPQLAISFSAFVVAPVAFAVWGFPVPPLFSIPSEIDLAPNQPVSRVSANSCCFLSQALDALAVQRSRSPGFVHRRFKRLTIPTTEVRSDPGRWFVIPDSINPVHDLDPLDRAPAGHEGTRDRRVASSRLQGHHSRRLGYSMGLRSTHPHRSSRRAKR